jgi:hypothetical protein
MWGSLDIHAMENRDVIDCAKIVLKIIQTGIIIVTDRTIVKQSRP